VSVVCSLLVTSGLVPVGEKQFLLLMVSQRSSKFKRPNLASFDCHDVHAKLTLAQLRCAIPKSPGASASPMPRLSLLAARVRETTTSGAGLIIDGVEHARVTTRPNTRLA